MAFQSSSVTIGQSTKKSDYDRLLDNTQYLKTELAKASKGKADITISEYDTTAAPDVKAKSVFENNGTVTEVATDTTPTGYAGISSGTTFYTYWDESESVFIYSAAAPTWSDLLQGWYNGNDRAFFSMYKDSGGTLYENKSLLSCQNNISLNGSLSLYDRGVNQDRNIEFASDADLLWDESEDKFELNKKLSVPTINTGHGDNDLYEMNQNVKKTDTVEFASITAATYFKSDYRKPRTTLHGNFTRSALHGVIAGAIDVNGSKAILSGAIDIADAPAVLSYAIRNSSTQTTVYYLACNGVAGSQIWASTDFTTVNVSISW